MQGCEKVLAKLFMNVFWHDFANVECVFMFDVDWDRNTYVNNMQFSWMREQHHYALHLLRVSWNLFCGNAWNLQFYFTNQTRLLPILSAFAKHSLPFVTFSNVLIFAACVCKLRAMFRLSQHSFSFLAFPVFLNLSGHKKFIEIKFFFRE